MATPKLKTREFTRDGSGKRGGGKTSCLPISRFPESFFYSFSQKENKELFLFFVNLFYFIDFLSKFSFA
jgi:hypothetical protein